MKRLFNLKAWVTPDEAAAHLSAVFNEPVTVADIYRFALDKHLILSVHFVNFARGNLGHLRSAEEAEVMIVPGIRRMVSKDPIDKDLVKSIPRESRTEMLEWARTNSSYFESGEMHLMIRGEAISPNEFLQFDERMSTLRDVWDLSMLGAEALDIQHALQQEIGGPAVELVSLGETLVLNPSTGQFARVMEHYDNNEYAKKDEKRPYDDPNSYYPAGGLPRDAPLVIRMAALMDFIQRQSEGGPPSAQSKALRADAKLTYARIIAALWQKAHGDGGPGKISNDPYTAAASLANLLADAGIEKPSADKIGRVLTDEVGAAGIKIGNSEKPP